MPRIPDEELTPERIDREIEHVKTSASSKEVVLTLDASLGFRFGIKIRDRGKRQPSAQWFFQEGRSNGQKRTLKPGYPYLDKTRALVQALEIARKLHEGQPLRKASTPEHRQLKGATKEYLEYKKERVGNSTLVSHRRYCNLLMRYLAPSFDIDLVSSQDVHGFTSGIRDKKGAKAGNLAIHAVKGLFRWARQTGLTVANPCRDLEHFQPTREEKQAVKDKRPFYPRELKAYWPFWTRSERPDPTIIATKLTVLTGQRPGTEVLQMRKKDLLDTPPESILARLGTTPPDTGDGCWWHIPETKNSHEHMVYLPGRVLSIISPLLRGRRPNDYVFSLGSNGPIHQKTFNRLAVDTRKSFTEFPYWSIGLTSRRTFNTWLAKQGCLDDVQAALFNHRTYFSFSKKTYSCWDYLPERVEWFSRYSDHVLGLVGEP